MIVRALRERPMNMNELAKQLDLDFKTVKYHLDILREHGMVEKIGNGYGAVYVISKILQKYWNYLEQC